MHIAEFNLHNNLNNYNFLEYDVIILNLNIDYNGIFVNLQQISESLKAFLAQKKLLVTFMPESNEAIGYTRQLFHYLSITIDFELKAGTKLEFSEQYSHFLPAGRQFCPSSLDNIQPTQSVIYSTRNYKYRSLLRSKISKNICWVKNNKTQVLGAEFNYDKGKIILIPDLNYNFIQKHVEYLLSKNDFWNETVLPEWAEQYNSPQELTFKNEIEEIRQEIINLQNKIDKIQEKINIEDDNKLLFAGKDTSLEKQVGIILEKIGFSVESPEDNRVDHIITYKDRVAVVEVKGLSKSAQEKNAAQLDKWWSEYREKHPDVLYPEPKSILIVNAFADTPLNERNEQAFPSQMLSYATDRKQCLITGLQLYNIYYHLQSHTDQRDKIIQNIFSTIGCFKDFNNLSSFAD